MSSKSQSTVTSHYLETSESETSHEEQDEVGETTSSLAFSEPSDCLKLKWLASKLGRIDQHRAEKLCGKKFYYNAVKALANALGQLPIELLGLLVPMLNEKGKPKLKNEAKKIFGHVYKYYSAHGGELKKSFPKLEAESATKEQKVKRVKIQRRDKSPYDTKVMIQGLFEKEGTFTFCVLIVIKLFEMRIRLPDDPDREEIFTQPMLDRVKAAYEMEYKMELALPEKFKAAYRISDLVLESDDDFDKQSLDKDEDLMDPDPTMTANQIAQKLKSSNKTIRNLEGCIRQTEKTLREQQGKLAREVQQRDSLVEQHRIATEQEKTLTEAGNVFGNTAEGFIRFNEFVRGLGLYANEIMNDKEMGDLVKATFTKLKESRANEEKALMDTSSISANAPIDDDARPCSSMNAVRHTTTSTTLEVVPHLSLVNANPPTPAIEIASDHSSGDFMGQTCNISNVPVFFPVESPILRPPRLGLNNPNVPNEPVKAAAPTREELFGTFRHSEGYESPLPYGSRHAYVVGFQDLDQELDHRETALAIDRSDKNSEIVNCGGKRLINNDSSGFPVSAKRGKVFETEGAQY